MCFLLLRLFASLYKTRKRNGALHLRQKYGFFILLNTILCIDRICNIFDSLCSFWVAKCKKWTTQKINETEPTNTQQLRTIPWICFRDIKILHKIFRLKRREENESTQLPNRTKRKALKNAFYFCTHEKFNFSVKPIGARCVCAGKFVIFFGLFHSYTEQTEKIFCWANAISFAPSDNQSTSKTCISCARDAIAAFFIVALSDCTFVVFESFQNYVQNEFALSACTHKLLYCK